MKWILSLNSSPEYRVVNIISCSITLGVSDIHNIEERFYLCIWISQQSRQGLCRFMYTCINNFHTTWTDVCLLSYNQGEYSKVHTHMHTHTHTHTHFLSHRGNYSTLTIHSTLTNLTRNSIYGRNAYTSIKTHLQWSSQQCIYHTDMHTSHACTGQCNFLMAPACSAVWL